MPIAKHDTELEEFCQEFGIQEIEDDEDYDYCHFPLDGSLDLEDYLAEKDPQRILSQMVDTGQISLIYDLLEHISHNAIESFSGMILLYADRNDDGTFSVYQDVFNARSGIADRQSCTITVSNGHVHIDTA